MFEFKRFTIEQDRTAMKVGTDGVLLGAWVSLSGDERRILDIGTGTGLIAIMIAQRTDNESVHVDAVEIDKSSAEQATENVSRSDWAEQIEVHRVDIQSFTPSEKYDLIVTNPPYFVGSLLSPDKCRTTARHTEELTFKELVKSSVRLLNRKGRLALILPTTETQLFDKEAIGELQLVRRCMVFGKAGAAAKRVMSEYRLSDEVEEQPQISEQLTIRGGDPFDFTDEYKKITSDFYLKF
ncbi:MAG: methyltransferase [Rikenellaceae bacterium]